MAKSKRWLNAAVVAGVAAVTVAAVVSYVRADPSSSPAVPSETETSATETEPPDTGGTLPGLLPSFLALPPELRKQGGLLWWAGGDCEASALDVSSGLVAEAPGSACDIWPSPDGAAAVANAQAPSGAAQGGTSVVLFTYPQPDAPPVLERGATLEDMPAFITPAAWQATGGAFALCISGDDGIAVAVHDHGDATSRTIDGACYASFLGDGRLAVARTGAEIEVGGKVIFDQTLASTLLPGGPANRAYVTALGALGDRLVVGLRAEMPSSAAVAVLAPDGKILFSAQLGPDAYVGQAGLAPGGDALWYVDGGQSSAVVILGIPGAERMEPSGALWVTWSPSGKYLAAATEQGIEIVTWPEDHLVATLNVAANMVTWTRSSGG